MIKVTYIQGIMKKISAIVMNIMFTLIAFVIGSPLLVAPIHDYAMAEDKVVAERVTGRPEGKELTASKDQEKTEQKQPAAESKTASYPPYPNVWGRDISQYNAVVSINPYKTPNGDIMFLIVSDTEKKGIHHYRAMYFFSGEVVDIGQTEKEMVAFFRSKPLKQIKIDPLENRTVRFNDNTIVELYSMQEPRLCDGNPIMDDLIINR